MLRPRRTRHEHGLVQQIVLILGISLISGVLVAGLLVPVAGLVSMGAQRSADAAAEWPLELRFDTLQQRSTVYAADGTAIASFYRQNRVYVPLAKMSPWIQRAVISIEDKRFYEHGALDIKGTARALVTNQTSGEVIQGGSTITQQLVKLTLQSQARTDRQRKAATAKNFERKVLEWRYATWVENNLTKREILEHYLNAAYFGDGAWGIQSAARHYFDVNAAQLSLKQSALLAGLVKNPSGYNPAQYAKKAKIRRDTVIDALYDQHQVSKGVRDRIAGSKLDLTVTYVNNGCLDTVAPFFCDYVKNYLMYNKNAAYDETLGKTPTQRLQTLTNGGLKIYTTIDLKMQRNATTAVSSSVDPTDNALGSVALVQPGTGFVKAIAQSRPMGSNAAKGETYIDYAVPKRYGGSGGFNVGSTFKPFVLAAAIEQGIPLHYTIEARKPINFAATPMTFETCRGTIVQNDDSEIPNAAGIPYGDYDLYTGTRKSVNVFYIKLEEKTGLCKPYRLARKMGVNPGSGRLYQVPTFTLGVSDVSMLEMAEAYATFAARGVHCASTPILQITDREGKPLKTPRKQCKQVIEQTTADAINDILKGILDPGGFAQLQNLGRPAGGKTGTSGRTGGNKSATFVGYTPNLSGAATIAGANQRGFALVLDGQVVNGVYVGSSQISGSGFAAPMWRAAMFPSLSKLPVRNFVPPTDIVVRGDSLQIAPLTGYSYDDAAAYLSGLGLVPQQGPGAVVSDAPKGTVAYVTPGQYVLKGDTVTIYLSSGPKPDPDDKPGRGGNGGNGGGNGNGNGNGNGGGNGGGG